VSDCIFSDNQAGSSTGSYDSGGGAIYSGAGTLNIQAGLFHKNQALGGGDIGKGGAIYIGSSSTEPSSIDGAVFVNNGADVDGGAVYSDMSPVEISNTYFAGNVAKNQGGALKIWSGSAGGTSRLLNLRITGNVANDGGGLFYGEAVQSHYVSQSILAGNVAQGNGGALSISGASPIINHSAFVGNEVGPSGLGAAIYNDYGSNPQMHNSIVWKNISDGGGPMMGSITLPSHQMNISPSPTARWSWAMMGVCVQIRTSCHHQHATCKLMKPGPTRVRPAR
jgi:hypothetical protein